MKPLPARGHDFEEIIPPTCTEPGYAISPCRRCGDPGEIIPPRGHDFTVEIDHSDATCEEDGFTTNKCSRCDETHTDIIPAPGHNWSEGVITVPPTVDSEGVLTFTCKRVGCNATQTEAIPRIKTIAVGTQSGELTAGRAGTVTFQVTTKNIANGNYTASVANLPVGITVQGQVSISDGSGTLTLAGTASTVAGSTSTLLVTIDNVTSEAFTITVSSSASPSPSPSPTPSTNTVVDNPGTDIANTETPLTSAFAAFINGYPDSTFRGTRPITREEFINILFKLKSAQGLSENEVSNMAFNDVKPERWSFGAIEWAAKAGIIKADAEGNFNPGKALLRSEMAVMLAKAEGWTEIAENIFSDIDGYPEHDDILKAVKAGVFEGYPDGTFKPDNTITRYELVTAMVRYLLVKEAITDDMWKEIVVTFTDIPREHWAFKYVALATSGYIGNVKSSGVEQ
jgi:hypothetical protein